METIDKVPAKKLRGGFYTPKSIVDFILKWGFNESINYKILEPSCGDGIFLKRIKENQYQYDKIKALELNSKEAKKTRKLKLKNATIINTDFHKYCNSTRERFDLIIGNPPYIRYQYFDRQQQKEAENIFKRANLKYSRLTNAWVSFVIGSSLLLKETGKLGFVLPAELLQVSYAKTLRNFLAHFYNKINIVSFKKLVFPEIQQEVILLLCEKTKDKTHMIEHLELKDKKALKKANMKLLKSPSKKIDFTSNKWTFYFLSQKEINFLETIQQENVFPRIGDFANVEVGITTGANDFFTVPENIVNSYNLKKYAKPMVGRSIHIKSVYFSKADWEENKNAGAKAFLLVLPEEDKLNGNKAAKKYVLEGEKKGIHKGYKCSVRDEWFRVPSIKLSDAFFVRRNNIFPRLILNEAKAYTTDTMHRVNLKPNTEEKAFIASFYNSISLAFSEIFGRSYGGGVLELMPSETSKIFLPYLRENNGFLSEIDKMFRKNYSIDKILQISNDLFLKKGYGLSDSEIILANNIWKKLSNRRLTRKSF